jgi:membrane protein DedA with SNARE-associated domain
MQSIPFQLACPVIGAFVGDLTGFVVGMAVGYAVSAAIWLATLERVRRSVSVPGSVSEPAVVGT